MAIELRDQFAIAAMKALSAKLVDPNMIAKNAYKIADAMLRARIADLPDTPLFNRFTGSRRSLKAKATNDQIPIILQLKNDGLTNKQIADKLKLNGQSVNGVVAVFKTKIASYVGKKSRSKADE